MNTRASTTAAVERVVPLGADWRDLARCREVDADLFFPEAERGARYEAQVAAAKRVCAGCLVRSECLSFALRSLGDGIAGGLTPEERRGLSRPPADRMAVLEQSARTAVTRRQRADAGRALLAAGRSVAAVAELCRVTETSARRWARAVAEQLGESA